MEITLEPLTLDVEQVKSITLDDLEPEVKKITLEKRVVSNDEVDYESLTLKELKEKVTAAGGPKLRTKKELIDFLKK